MSTESDSGSDSVETAEQDLQQRLMLATPEHTTRGFLFSSTLRVVQELGEDEAVVRRCMAASGEASFVEFFHYPTRSLLLLLSTAAEALSGQYGGFEEALRQIGFRAGESYMDTPVGRAATQHAGPPHQRLMVALQTLYWALTNYSNPSVSAVSPHRGTISIQATFMPPAYHEGGARAIASRMGVKFTNIRARKTGALSLDLDVLW